MKKCKCGTLWADDYNGTCSDCGAGLATQAGTVGNLEHRFAQQNSEANRARMVESQVEGRNYEGIRGNNPVFQMAKEFVLDKRTPEQRERDELIGA